MNYKGTLIPVGGNEDKGMGLNGMYSLDFIKHGKISERFKIIGIFIHIFLIREIELFDVY